jgi:monoamine oxidase
VELRLQQGEQWISVQARRVVLALPPRLAEARIRFEPALPDGLTIALRATPTWMATAAKAAFAYPRPFWRQAGHTGNAWVTHPQAVLAEVFDASAPTDLGGAALAGFLAQSAEGRLSFEGGMELLLRSQIGQIYGLEAEDGELHRKDWARDPCTCSPLDLQQDGQPPVAGQGHTPDPVILDALTGAWWHGRLLFGGAETARRGNGYLEGALAAAARLRGELLANPTGNGAGAGSPSASPEADNNASLRQFTAWVSGERSQALHRYRTRLHQALSRQDDVQLTQKAVLGALESLYEDALAQLDALPLAVPAQPDASGRAELTPQVLAPFKGLADELLTDAVRFNNTSCALSNFPYEHKPPRDYVQTIRRDLAATWQAFALAANERLLAKAGGATPTGAWA